MRWKKFGKSNCYQCHNVICLYDYLCLEWIFFFKVPRKTWVLQWPGQVVICVSSIYWTEEVSEAIRKGTLLVRFSSTILFLSTKLWLINKKLLLAKKILCQQHITIYSCSMLCFLFPFFLCLSRGLFSFTLMCIRRNHTEGNCICLWVILV